MYFAETFTGLPLIQNVLEINWIDFTGELLIQLRNENLTIILLLSFVFKNITQ